MATSLATDASCGVRRQRACPPSVDAASPAAHQGGHAFGDEGSGIEVREAFACGIELPHRGAIEPFAHQEPPVFELGQCALERELDVVEDGEAADERHLGVVGSAQ